MMEKGLTRCGDSNVPSETRRVNNIPGERVVLVFPWVVDGDFSIFKCQKVHISGNK